MQVHLHTGEKFKMKTAYSALQSVVPKVSWRNLFYSNLTRPISQFVLWLACNDKLTTKDQLHIFVMVADDL